MRHRPAFNLDAKTVTLAADEARHLRDVLRLKNGEEVYVFDGAGREFRCIVINTRRDSALLQIDAEVEPAKPESQLQLNLCVALFKGEKFDLVVQKATELGVKSVTPIITRYADIHLRDSADSAKRVDTMATHSTRSCKTVGKGVCAGNQCPDRF